MAKINLQVKGLRKLKRAFIFAPTKVGKEIEDGLKKSIVIVEREAKRSITTGRTRAIDTGRLRASHFSRVKGLTGEIFPTVNYAIFVHEGTRFMRSRPWLEKAARNARNDVKKELQKSINRALEKAFK